MFFFLSIECNKIQEEGSFKTFDFVQPSLVFACCRESNPQLLPQPKSTKLLLACVGSNLHLNTIIVVTFYLLSLNFFGVVCIRDLLGSNGRD